MNIISQTPTVTAGAYSADDAVGGKLTFTGCPEDGLIHNAVLIDNSEQAVELDLVLFSEDFTAVADNAAFTVSDADAANIVTIINIPAANYKDIGGQKVAVVENKSIPFKLTEDTSTKYARLYGQLITRGTPTYVATTDITVKIGVLPYSG